MTHQTKGNGETLIRLTSASVYPIPHVELVSGIALIGCSVLRMSQYTRIKANVMKASKRDKMVLTEGFSNFTSSYQAFQH